MKTFIFQVFFTTICCVFAHYGAKRLQSPSYSRVKRDAVGALHIVTNHAQPIHADVKSEGDGTEKVTPPEETQYALKSLRKSLPLQFIPSTLDLVRSISRVVTLVILFISAVLEFYPTIQGLLTTIYTFFGSQ